MVIQVRAGHVIALLLALPPVLSSTSLLFLKKVVDLLVPLLLFYTFRFRFFRIYFTPMGFNLPFGEYWTL